LRKEQDKDNTSGKMSKKTKEQLLEQIENLSKTGLIDKLQEFVDKYNSKVKLLQ
jgi:hypothetical protein